MAETREEHLAWCKKRALEYIGHGGDLKDAVVSMLCDLSKHPDTARVGEDLGMIGILEIQRGPEAVRRWIEGFN